MASPNALEFLNAHGDKHIAMITATVAVNFKSAQRLFEKRNIPKIHQPARTCKIAGFSRHRAPERMPREIAPRTGKNSLIQ